MTAPKAERRINAATLRRRLGRQSGQCTWCGQPVPKGSRTWCSNACVDQFRARHDPAFLRSAVYRRDHGICAACGLDTVWFRQSFRARTSLLPSGDTGDDWEIYCCLRHRRHWRDLNVRPVTRRGRGGLCMFGRQRIVCTCLPCSMRRQASDLSGWDADHIVPLHRGGANEIANLRTLCRACHKRVTAAQARDRAAKRRLLTEESSNG